MKTWLQTRHRVLCFISFDSGLVEMDLSDVTLMVFDLLVLGLDVLSDLADDISLSREISIHFHDLSDGWLLSESVSES